MKIRVLALGFAALASFTAFPCTARPFVPAGDDVVVERLPERVDPSLRQLKRLRAALARNPNDLDTAASVARRAIAAARAAGDPRFLGQAQAALSPWWTDSAAPSVALLLRATVKQSQHDFQGALVDLDRLVDREPASGQALLTRATILGVIGRHADAQRDCRRLARLVTPLVATACIAGPASLSGDSGDAYRALRDAIAGAGDPPGIRAWALTLAGEIAARRGDAVAADAHFRDALALDPGDAYLAAAYADFLLDNGRPRDVLPLASDRTRNDALLLRLALAEQRLPEARDSFDAHRAELAARFDAARARGDSLHKREEARFRLAIQEDAQGALRLALENWKVQREPADLRVLAEASRAAEDAAAKRIVDEWIAATRIDDVTLAVTRREKP